MKIMYFLAHPWSVGGAINIMLSQASIIQGLGNEIGVILQNDDNNEHLPEYDLLCERYNLKPKSMKYSIATCIEEIDIVRSFSDYESIYNEVKEFSPDLIHSLQLNTTVELVSRDLSIPHVMNIYQIARDMFRIKWMDILPQYHSCDSEFYSSQWREKCLYSKCIRTYYESKSANCINNKKSNLDRIELINVASFGEHKRQYEICKLIKKCVDVGIGVHITFLGAFNNSYGEKCQKYVIENNLSENITFAGIVLNVDDFYINSDILIHASTAESYPCVIIEAMANKLPIITTPVAGIPELVVNEKNGFLTNGFSYDDLFDALIKYIEFKNDGKIEEIADNEYVTYLDNHTKKKISDELVDYYNMIICNYKPNKKLSSYEIKDVFKQEVIDIESFSSFTKGKLWFLYHIKNVIEERRIYSMRIWGAGFWGEHVAEWSDFLNIKMNGYIDRQKKGMLNGNIIIHPDDLEYKSSDVIFVSVNDLSSCQDIGRELEKKGYVRNESYFFVFNNPCMIV